MKTSMCLRAVAAFFLWSGVVAASPAKADALPPGGAAKLTQGAGGQCLAAGGASNGAAIALGACTSGLDWTFAAVSGGYTIQTGGRCMDGGPDGGAATLWTCDGSPEQVWSLAAQGDGSSVQNKRFAKCLQASGTQTVLAACSGTAATQSWKTSSTGTGGPGGGTGGGTATGTTSVLPPTGAAKLTYGTSERCLTAGGAGNGAPIAAGACASGSDWTFTAVAGGYTIKAGNVCMDGGADGSAAALWACDGSTEQVWLLSAQGDGSSIQNKRFSKCLQGGEGLASCAATATQSWKAYGSSGTGGTGTATWTRCAGEEATCTFSGTRTVRYGANGTYATRTATNSILCSYTVFGDPVPNVVKTCEVQSDASTGTGTAGWTPCAAQDATCTFSGTRTVRYGANGTYATRTATGSIRCSHEVFGDPLYGVVKTCDVQSDPGTGTGTGTAAWTPCAVQEATCTFSGTRLVRYGANGSYATRTATNSILCSHTVFGDPLYGVIKTCDVQSGTGTGGGDTPGGTDPVTPPGETPTNGNVFLINRQSGMCVTIPGGRANPGQQSVQTICRGAAAETWSFVAAGTGYQIKNLASGLCLYADRGLTVAGPSTLQQPCNPSTDGGRWQIRKADQWFEIVGVQSGRCITVADGSRNDGGPLHQQDCSGGNSQRFTVAPASFATASWTAPRRIDAVPVSAAPLPNGKLLMWGGDGRTSFDGGGNTWTTLYDPATDSATVTNVTGAGQMFCPGTNILADGRILVNGGRNAGGTSFYDPSTNTWSAGPAMNIARGYNGNTTLSTGEGMTYGGSWSGSGTSDKFAEVYSPATGKWRVLSGVSGDAAASRESRDPVVRDNHYWLFAARDGFAFNAGPDPKMFWIDTRGNGALQGVGTRGDDVWSQSGTVTMYDVGRILKIGGAPNDTGQYANPNTYTIDISQGPGTTPTVTKLGADPFPRVFHNSVVLPDGDVVTVGGHNTGQGFVDDKAVMIPTIWSPATGKYRLLPPISIPRTYHSWAVLMPDGRVASGGGGLCGDCSVNHPDFQFLSPPYLYDASGRLAARPAITQAPSSAEVGSSLGVATDRAVSRFALVRMSATTHTVNADQRRVPVAIASQSGNTYQLALPAERGVLLPGPWMLFAMDANGVPSVSKVVRIR